MSNLEAIIVKSTKELLGMANVRKHDCESVCKDRGLTYLRELNHEDCRWLLRISEIEY